MKKNLIFLVPVALIIIIITGCAGVSEEVISFADGATENFLIALNNQDYESYKKDLDSAMLEAVPEEDFIKFSSYLKDTAGEYVAGSKEMSKSGIQKETNIIVYEANYTGESEKMIVTMVISEIGDGSFKISGSWFNSPELRENPYQ
jgi:PBP1b-binding outer membrane lipoprotein LpoB